LTAELAAQLKVADLPLETPGRAQRVSPGKVTNILQQTGPPPMKWSDSKYGFAIEEDCNGEEETQPGRDRCEVASG